MLTAALAGDTKETKRLLEGKADVNDGKKGDKTPIYGVVRAAASRKQSAAVKLADEAFRQAMLSTGIFSSIGQSKYLELQNALEIISLLIKFGADPNTKDTFGSLFTQAAEAESETAGLAMCKLLLDHKADIEGETSWGTALAQACKRGHANLARYLIKEGANVNKATMFRTPLIAAIEEKHEALAKALIEEFKADVNVCVTSRSLLSAAIENGVVSFVDYLLTERKANRVYPGMSMTLPLEAAVKTNQPQMLKHLVARHNFKLLEDRQRTAFHVAAQCANIAMLKFMVEEILPITKEDLLTVVNATNVWTTSHVSPNSDGPLHSAAERRVQETMKYLIALKADVNQMTTDGPPIAHLTFSEGTMKPREQVESPSSPLACIRVLLEAKADAFLSNPVREGSFPRSLVRARADKHNILSWNALRDIMNAVDESKSKSSPSCLDLCSALNAGDGFIALWLLHHMISAGVTAKPSFEAPKDSPPSDLTLSYSPKPPALPPAFETEPDLWQLKHAQEQSSASVKRDPLEALMKNAELFDVREMKQDELLQMQERALESFRIDLYNPPKISKEKQPASHFPRIPADFIAHLLLDKYDLHPYNAYVLVQKKVEDSKLSAELKEFYARWFKVLSAKWEPISKRVDEQRQGLTKREAELKAKAEKEKREQKEKEVNANQVRLWFWVFTIGTLWYLWKYGFVSPFGSKKD